MSSDPLIGQPIALQGKLVDLDPAAVWNSQIFFNTIARGQLMNRREILKLGLFSSGAVLLSNTINRVNAQAPPNIEPATGGYFNPPSPSIINKHDQELNRITIKKHLPGGAADLKLPENGGVEPNGTVYPQITGVEAMTTYENSLERIVAIQQRNFSSNPLCPPQFPPKKFYAMYASQFKHTFHPDAPYDKGSIVWGYDGIHPGPTFMSRYGEPILIRVINRLFFPEEDRGDMRVTGGFGDPRISTHLHNGHTGSESDGNPTDIYPPEQDPKSHLCPYPESIKNLKFRDHHYGMFRAGLDPAVPSDQKKTPNRNDGDSRETVSTLWYHDHSMDRTAANVYRGLVGFHLFFDDVDSGDENDPSDKALKLPSGEFDIPLLFQDKRFDEFGQPVLKSATKPDEEGQTKPDEFGILGDRFVVNGQIQPKVSVRRRKYRFRLLNAGPSRFYQFFLTKNGVPQKMTQIGNDESLLEEPYEVPLRDGILISVAERADVIIDFKDFAIGDQLLLVNRLVMKNDGTGPRPDDDDPKKYKLVPEGTGDEILLFDVIGDAASNPNLPAKLRKNPDLPAEVVGKKPDELKKLPNHRCFEFGFDENSQWTINNRTFDSSPAGDVAIGDRVLPANWLATPRGGLLPKEKPDGEIWTIKNTTGSTWAHPVHVHLEEFRILFRNGKAPKDSAKYEDCRKDVLRLDPEDEVQIFLRFRDFLGKYPIHCHNVLHEDHQMMMRFDVVGDY